jgi:hypothetical protein
MFYIGLDMCVSSSLFVRKCRCKIRERSYCQKIMYGSSYVVGINAGGNRGWKQFTDMCNCTFILINSLCLQIEITEK